MYLDQQESLIKVSQPLSPHLHFASERGVPFACTFAKHPNECLDPQCILQPAYQPLRTKLREFYQNCQGPTFFTHSLNVSVFKPRGSSTLLLSACFCSAPLP